jgi:hypothetical protein
VYERYRRDVLTVEGVVQRQDGVLNVVAERVEAGPWGRPLW